MCFMSVSYDSMKECYIHTIYYIYYYTTYSNQSEIHVDPELMFSTQQVDPDHLVHLKPVNC